MYTYMRYLKMPGSMIFAQPYCLVSDDRIPILHYVIFTRTHYKITWCKIRTRRTRQPPGSRRGCRWDTCTCRGASAGGARPRTAHRPGTSRAPPPCTRSPWRSFRARLLHTLALELVVEERDEAAHGVAHEVDVRRALGAVAGAAGELHAALAG